MRQYSIFTGKMILPVILIALTIGGFVIAEPVHAALNVAGLEYCDGRSAPIDKYYAGDDFCHTVKSGETLWSISKFFLGSGFSWKNLSFENKDLVSTPPRKLEPGMRILVRGAFIRSLEVSPDGKNISWLVDTKPAGISGCKYEYHGFRFVVNNKANSAYSCGWNYELITYSPNGENYAVRGNKGDQANPEQFHVLSNIKNGSYYDYVDSLAWFNDETLVYRAQRHDKWRVVVNNVDGTIFDYIDNLMVTKTGVSFRARHSDGTWTEERIVLNKR